MASDFYQHPDLYDALLPVGAHLPFYLELARQHPEGVLELACGTGQLTVPIAGAGLTVFGLAYGVGVLGFSRAEMLTVVIVSAAFCIALVLLFGAS